MPTLTSNRKSKCTVCKQPIQVGEYIDYTRALGARHMTCSDQIPIRLNEYPSKCDVCGSRLGAGQGTLTYDEHQEGDRFTGRWLTVCLNSYECHQRINRPTDPEPIEPEE